MTRKPKRSAWEPNATSSIEASPAEWIDRVETPAYVFRKCGLSRSVNLLRRVLGNAKAKCRLLFALKACSIPDVASVVQPYVDGFSVSSLNEAKLASEILKGRQQIHFTSPGLRTDETREVLRLCTHLNFNSLSQLHRFMKLDRGTCQLGLRLNTGLSFVSDDRHNPCRKHSKLGVPLDSLTSRFDQKSGVLSTVNGLLVHTNSESEDFSELASTVKLLDRKIPWLLMNVDWVNLGGGYLFGEDTDWRPLYEALALLANKYSLDVFFEPGKGVVGESGFIVSSVLDLFEVDEKAVAVLDTTVSHMPEILEFQYKPQVWKHEPDGRYAYILSGASCLAGDVFGEYRFSSPLEVGSRVVFADMGAYSFVKANWYNGINIAAIYLAGGRGNLYKCKSFGYLDFSALIGARNASL